MGYETEIVLPAALPPCDHCVLRWEWTAHQQVSNIEFYVQCADIKIVSNAGPTKPSTVVAITGLQHLPSTAAGYRKVYNGEFGDQYLLAPAIATFSSCVAGSAGCISGSSTAGSGNGGGGAGNGGSVTSTTARTGTTLSSVGT